jgi:hypothetical protein
LEGIIQLNKIKDKNMNPLAYWMYNIKTGQAKLFNSTDEYVESEWTDTPALCDEQITQQEVLEAQADRAALKEEATALGLEFQSNVKTAKLIEMIIAAKGGSIVPVDVPVETPVVE